MHERPMVSELWAYHTTRMLKESRIDHTFQIAVSDDASARVCKDYNLDFVRTENNPIGAKWNAALTAALEKEWDYLLISGDDDVLSPELIQIAKREFHKHTPHFGFRQIYFLCAKYKKAVKFGPSTRNKNLIGAGRFIHRSAIEKIGSNWWESELNKGLDNSLEKILTENGFPSVAIETDRPLMADVKTSKNIWSFSKHRNYSEPVSFEDATAFFYPEDLQRLSEITRLEKKSGGYKCDLKITDRNGNICASYQMDLDEWSVNHSDGVCKINITSVVD